MALYNILVLFLLIFATCCVTVQDAGDIPRRLPVPPGRHEHLTENHHLSKRQSQFCQVFYLNEPPSFLQCNPQINRLILQCEFLVGAVTHNDPIAINMGWFFSLDGIQGELVQVTRFESRRSFSAFDNVLVVLNPLPGAYFCSTSLLSVIFDSNALRVDSQTLQNVCLPRQNPILQGNNSPRCAQTNIPTPNTIRTPVTREMATNTINLQAGVEIITPTYTILFERTVNIPPEVTPLVVVPQAANTLQVGIGVGVAIGVLLLLMLAIALIIIGAVCFIKERERNQKIRKRCLLTRFDNRTNREPLLRPPDRPPPLLQDQATIDNRHSQHEEIELDVYTPPDNNISSIPRPYEKTSPRYMDRQIPTFPATKIDLSQSTGHGNLGEDMGDVYYSRPKFKPRSNRTLSTSTHVYGDCNNGNNESSSLYISAQDLEPYYPDQMKEITEQELMLSDIEESVGYTSTDYTSGSEEGSLFDDDDNKPAETSAEYSIDNPPNWLGNKTPETGEVTSLEYSDQYKYVNARRDNMELLESTLESASEVEYVNTKRNGSVIKETNSTQGNIGTSSGTGRKKKIEGNKVSTPSSQQALEKSENDYTSLAQNTLNYTSVYVTTTSEYKDGTLSEES